MHNGLTSERQAGGAAAWAVGVVAMALYALAVCALCAAAGCTTANLRKVYDAAGKLIPVATTNETASVPSAGSIPPGAPPSADPAPSPAAPATSASGLKLKDGLPDWSDTRWYDAILVDGVYWYNGVPQ